MRGPKDLDLSDDANRERLRAIGVRLTPDAPSVDESVALIITGSDAVMTGRQFLDEWARRLTCVDDDERMALELAGYLSKSLREIPNSAREPFVSLYVHQARPIGPERAAWLVRRILYLLDCFDEEPPTKS